MSKSYRTFFYYQLLAVTATILFCSCGGDNPVPKPKAYIRIDMPQKEYRLYDTVALPFTFECPGEASVIWKQNDKRTKYFDILYPQYKGIINLTYKHFNNYEDLSALVDTASRMLALHHSQSTGEREVTLADPEGRVYATVVKVEGKNAGSTYQFWLTDSCQHFLRGALFLNYTPNNDSLAPVIEYLQADVDHIVESLQWR